MAKLVVKEVFDASNLCGVENFGVAHSQDSMMIVAHVHLPKGIATRLCVEFFQFDIIVSMEPLFPMLTQWQGMSGSPHPSGLASQVRQIQQAC